MELINDLHDAEDAKIWRPKWERSRAEFDAVVELLRSGDPANWQDAYAGCCKLIKTYEEQGFPQAKHTYDERKPKLAVQDRLSNPYFMLGLVNGSKNISCAIFCVTMTINDLKEALDTI